MAEFANIGISLDAQMKKVKNLRNVSTILIDRIQWKNHQAADRPAGWPCFDLDKDGNTTEPMKGAAPKMYGKKAATKMYDKAAPTKNYNKGYKTPGA